MFSSRSAFLFFASVTSCCHRNTSPGSTAAAPAAVGYAGIVIVGRLMSLIAFAISGPPLYSFWMWFAMASTDFWYLAAYFALPMSKVWDSSPTTFVTNSFLAGAPFRAGLRD